MSCWPFRATGTPAARLNSAGGFVGAWALGGTTADYGYFIAVTAAGDPYVTGYFTGTADFYPGPDTYLVSSAGGWDMFLAKIVQPSVGKPKVSPAASSPKT